MAFSTFIYHFVTFVAINLLVLPFAAASYCDAPSPAFPIPILVGHASELESVANSITSALQGIIADQDYNQTSFSVEVTDQTRTLLNWHHTAKVRSTFHHGGAKTVTNDTRYRIASMTKPFTVLALFQLQKAGKLSLDDTILTHIPELNVSQPGSLPWKDITLRSLASQIAGIPRDLAQDDLINSPDRASELGLPKLEKHGRDEGLDLPTCDEMVNYTRACNSTDLLDWVKQLQPLFAPNQKSSYSNINYDLLGLVIANVTGQSYEIYIKRNILDIVGMNSTTFETPADDVAAVPAGIEYYWDFEIGVQNPTGGLYSSSADMSKWLRYVLSTYNAQTNALSWFNPTSFSGSIETFYGMPWEIYRARTKEVLEDEEASSRPLTFVTKGGGLPGYSSVVIMIPGYGLGITILVAGKAKLLGDVREVVVKEIARFAEDRAIRELESRYTGVYVDTTKRTNNRSTITLALSPDDGLYIKSWQSNGVNTQEAIKHEYASANDEQVLHVVPTLLFVNEKEQKGERWKIVPRTKRSNSNSNARKSVWDNFCIADWDINMYAGRSLNEIVFWGGKPGERVHKIELTGFRSTLRRAEDVEAEIGSADVLQDQTNFEL